MSKTKLGMTLQSLISVDDLQSLQEALETHKAAARHLLDDHHTLQQLKDEGNEQEMALNFKDTTPHEQLLLAALGSLPEQLM